MAYIIVNDIKDKTITNAITQAGWTDTDLQLRVDEAEAIIDGYVIKAGYLKTEAQNSVLLKKINILLAKYNVLRDLYCNVAPTKVEDRGFVKWKEESFALLEKILTHELVLIDTNGNVINYNVKKYTPQITTENVERIFKISKHYDWSEPLESYSDEDVVGNK